jgi:hypothetical protein
MYGSSIDASMVATYLILEEEQVYYKNFSYVLFLSLGLSLAACGEVYINDPLSNLSPSARERITEAMPTPVYKDNRRVEVIRSSPSTTPATMQPAPPAIVNKKGIISGRDGKMNCRRSPGGEIMGQYVNGSQISIDDESHTQYGTWYHDSRYNCFIHENGVTLR